MSIWLVPVVFGVVLTASVSTTYAGPCWDEIVRVQAEIDNKLEAIAAAGPPASARDMAATSVQPTPRSLALVEEKMGELSPETISAIRQSMDRARAADTGGDQAACEKALADVRRTLAQ